MKGLHEFYEIMMIRQPMNEIPFKRRPFHSSDTLQNVTLKPLFQSSQKLFRSSLRVLASKQKELTSSKQAL